MEYRDLVNGVLRRLRVAEVGFIADSTYSVMISDFVNQAKREVEDAHNWLALETTSAISSVASVDTYTLTGFGPRSRIRLVHNITSKNEIRPKDWDTFQRWKDFPDTANGRPTHWRINGVSSDGDPQIQFYPTPDATYTVNVYATVPQADLTGDGDVLTVPPFPVILGATALAISERGDDRGAAVQLAQKEYESALADAVARDSYNDNAGMGTAWVIV